MKEKIRNFFKKSYPKPIIAILLLIFFISIFISAFIAYQITNDEKANIEQRISEREQIIITEYDKQLEKYKKDVSEHKYDKYGLLKEAAQEVFKPKLQLSRDSELKRLNYVKNASFNALWLGNLENPRSSLFLGLGILVILILITLPIIRGLILLVLHITKKMAVMTTFQKYLICLLFGVLIILILILLKLF